MVTAASDGLSPKIDFDTPAGASYRWELLWKGLAVPVLRLDCEGSCWHWVCPEVERVGPADYLSSLPAGWSGRLGSGSSRLSRATWSRSSRSTRSPS